MTSVKDWGTRIVFVVLLAFIVTTPLVFRQQQEGPSIATAPADRLVIVSPHNEQIRYEFGRAFNRWRGQNGHSGVAFDWRTSGGTSDLRRMVLDQYTAAAKDSREEQGVGYDLFFGGGEYDHNKLAAGITIERDGQKQHIAIVEVPQLPPGLLDEAFPAPMIGGERLYHPEGKWIGTALSSFGIVYNRDVLAMLGLAEPQTWSDLSDLRYRGWIALADPAHSGSICATYNTILRRLGWEEGWKMLRRIYANARYFTSSASKVPVDVSAGEAAAGMCIDFYGRFQAGAVGADGRVGYVDPSFATAITADPITLLRGAPHQEIANQFIAWLLSEQGQQLWQLPRQIEGGPEKFALRRLPIRRDLYTSMNRARWSDRDVAPFDIARPFPRGMPNLFGTVAIISHAMAIDIHDDLINAWNAIVQSPNHPSRDQMVTFFERMPEALTVRWPDHYLSRHWRDVLKEEEHPRHGEVAEVLDSFVRGITSRWQQRPDLEIEDRMRWTLFFRDNYRQVVILARRDSG